METRALLCGGGQLSQVWRWERVCACGLVGAHVGRAVTITPRGHCGFEAGFCSCFPDENPEAWVSFATLRKSFPLRPHPLPLKKGMMRVEVGLTDQRESSRLTGECCPHPGSWGVT